MCTGRDQESCPRCRCVVWLCFALTSLLTCVGLNGFMTARNIDICVRQCRRPGPTHVVDEHTCHMCCPSASTIGILSRLV